MLNPGKTLKKVLKWKGMTLKDLWILTDYPSGYNAFTRRITKNKMTAVEFQQFLDILGYEIDIVEKN